MSQIGSNLQLSRPSPSHTDQSQGSKLGKSDTHSPDALWAVGLENKVHEMLKSWLQIELYSGLPLHRSQPNMNALTWLNGLLKPISLLLSYR
jgi:hypothetical protein